MEPKPIEKHKDEVKKVKDFQTAHDYFSYATNEFKNENVQFDGYKWSADDLFNMYLKGDKESVLKLAVPETPDYSNLPFIKSNNDKPDQPPLKKIIPGEDVVKFPCKPAQKTVERYFEAKEWDEKLLEHPRFMNWWANRHLDLGFAKVELMDAKQNLIVSQQNYEESMAQIKKDKGELKEQAEKLREFTIIFNNLAYHNIYKRIESEKKIQFNLELNSKKLEQGKSMMERVKKMIVAQDDLKVRIEKMQIYEDFLNEVVKSSNNKFENIQQILNRYDSVAYTKRLIVTNHLGDMYKMEVKKTKLMKYIAERQDIIRNYNNELSDLARRYKFVQKRYFHWENSVHKMKKLCNRERAQTQSVEASIWNLYVQMCLRKKMPVKVEQEDYKAQLAYILITIKQYEKIVEIAQQKYEMYLLTRTNSSMSEKTAVEKKDKELMAETGTPFGVKKHVESQTTEVGYVDVSTMIWWENEIQIITSESPSSTSPVFEERLSGEKTHEVQDDKLVDQIKLQEESDQIDHQIKLEDQLATDETIIAVPEKLEPEFLAESKINIEIQTDDVEMHDKNVQYEYFVTVHVQTLNAEELEKLKELQEQLEAEHKILAEDEQELTWLKEATELNLKLMRPSPQKPVLIRASEPRRSFARVDSADSIHSVESIRSKEPDEWDDTSAAWFYSDEWKESLDWDEFIAERCEPWESPVIPPTGRRLSVAMKEHSTVLYPSDRRESVVSFQAPIQPEDRRESTTVRESLQRRELEPPLRRESVGDGLLRRLRAALAEKDERLAQDEAIEVMESREESSREIKQTKSMEQEQIKLEEQKEIEAKRFGKGKSDIKSKDTQILDWHEIYLKELNLVDAWTQTAQKQTEDWVQTLPVKEQYGWSQTERIDKLTQTTEDDIEVPKVVAVTLQFTEASTQTDALPEEKKPSERIKIEEVSPITEQETIIPESTKLSARSKRTSVLSADLKSLSHGDSVEESSSAKLLKKQQISSKLPSGVLSDTRKKSQEIPKLSIQSVESSLSKLPASESKSLKDIKTVVPLKSSAKPFVSKTMVTIKEIAALAAGQDVVKTKKIFKPITSKDLSKLPAKKLPLKPLKEEAPTKKVSSTLTPVSFKISRPCKQITEKSVTLDKIHGTPSVLRTDEKRKLKKLKMTPVRSKTEIPIRVSWSGLQKQDGTSGKKLLPDDFTEISSSSSSSSSTTSIQSKGSILKEKFSRDRWKLPIDPSPRHSTLGIKEKLSSMGSEDEPKWSYASPSTSQEK